MRKLFFIAMIVLGTSLVQAQDEVEFTFFNDGAFALAIGDDIDDRCVTVKDASNTHAAITQIGSTFTYTIDAAGLIHRNGRPIGTPNPRAASVFTSGVFNRLYTKQSNNSYTGNNIQ